LSQRSRKVDHTFKKKLQFKSSSAYNAWVFGNGELVWSLSGIILKAISFEEHF